MSYWACFNCDLLFEVDGSQSTACPQCNEMLVQHRPERIFELPSEAPASVPIEDEEDVTRILPIPKSSGSGQRREVLERTTILPLDGQRSPSSRRPQAAPRKVASTDSEVWTSADQAKSSQMAGQADPAGPDPTPRRRERRGPRVRDKAPKAKERRTLDHAQPRRLDAGDETETNASKSLPPPPVVSSLFDQDDDSGLPDAIAHLVDKHLDESVDLMGPAQDSVPTKKAAPWGTGITIAVLVGLIAAALLTRPSSQATGPEPQNESGPVKRLTPVFDGLGIQLVPASGIDVFEDNEWLALGQEAARAAFGAIHGLTSLRGLTRSITPDDSGAYIKAITKAFSDKKKTAVFGLAFDATGTAEDLALIVRSLQRADRSQFGLLAERRVDGRVGLFRFTLGEGKVPAIGHAVVQVGNMGVRADIIGRDGSVSEPAGSLLKDFDDGQLNFAALDERLGTMNRRNPMVRVASVYLETGLDIESIVRLLETVRFGPDKERFTEIRLIVR